MEENKKLIMKETEPTTKTRCKAGRKKKEKKAEDLVPKVSNSSIDLKIKSNLIAELEDFMCTKYGKCVKVIPYEDCTSANNFSLASPVIDEKGRTVWVKVDVAIPRGNRSVKVYDGDEMANRYQQNVQASVIKAANRSLAKDKA